MNHMVIKKYILACFIFNICFSQSWIQTQRIEKQFKEAVSSYNSGRYAISETILNKIINSGFESFNEKLLVNLLIMLFSLFFHDLVRFVMVSFQDYHNHTF